MTRFPVFHAIMRGGTPPPFEHSPANSAITLLCEQSNNQTNISYLKTVLHSFGRISLIYLSIYLHKVEKSQVSSFLLLISQLCVIWNSVKQLKWKLLWEKLKSRLEVLGLNLLNEKCQLNNPVTWHGFSFFACIKFYVHLAVCVQLKGGGGGVGSRAVAGDWGGQALG